MELTERRKMKMEKKYLLGVGALFVVALLGVALVSAYQGNPEVRGPNYSEDRHEAMQEVFENLDYEGWVSLMTQDGRNPRVVDVITEDNFAKFVEAHNLRIEGDIEGARDILAELGLGKGIGPRDGSGPRGHGFGKGAHNGQGMRGQGHNGECPYA